MRLRVGGIIDQEVSELVETGVLHRNALSIPSLGRRMQHGVALWLAPTLTQLRAAKAPSKPIAKGKDGILDRSSERGNSLDEMRATTSSFSSGSKTASAVDEEAARFEQRCDRSQNGELLSRHPDEIVWLQTPANIDPAPHNAGVACRAHRAEFDRKSCFRSARLTERHPSSRNQNAARYVIPSATRFSRSRLRRDSIAIARDNRPLVLHHLGEIRRSFRLARRRHRARFRPAADQQVAGDAVLGSWM